MDHSGLLKENKNALASHETSLAEQLTAIQTNAGYIAGNAGKESLKK